MSILAVKAPWRERNGRFSPLKAVVFAALFAPAVWLAFELATGRLGPKPTMELIHGSGDWAIRLLLASLLITPLRKFADWPKLIAVRRMVGLASFTYAFAHLSLYAFDQGFDFVHIGSEILRRFYLTLGFVTLLGLGALAATSTDAAIRRLGAPAWNRLHKLVYLLAPMGLLHYFIQAKADVSQPVVWFGFFAALMAFRLASKRLSSPIAATSVAVLASLALAPLAEAGWYAFVRHIDFWRVLAANVDPDMFPRPSVYIAGVGALALIVALVRRRRAPRRSRALAAAE